MSYYYNYFIGYRDVKTGKIYPLGPYNRNGKIIPVLTKSRSFASDLHESFLPIKDEWITDELRKDFEYENYKGEKEISVKYLPESELPEGSFIKTGYFLIKDVESYERDKSEFEGFYDYLTPQVYAAKLDNQLKFGPNLPKDDGHGGTYTESNASDYMFYAYPKFNSKEYECFIISESIFMLEDYTFKDIEYVVLETEG